MARRFRSQPTPADLVALARALELDEARTRDERDMRDRHLVENLPADLERRASLPLAWLDAECAGNQALADRREGAQQAMVWAGVALGAAGGLSGTAVALGAFFYDGGGRVNVVSLLGLLVVVPGLLLLPFLFALLPPRWLGWLPGAAAVSALVRALSPGRLGFLLLKRMPASWREAVEVFTADIAAGQQLRGRLRKWLVMRWTQTYALAFQVAALATALALVAFTDLIFGWSTTLASGDPIRDANRMHGVVAAISAPWAWVFDEAVPSPALIAQSRYYRSVADAITTAEATLLGGWWTFVVMAMFTYGLLPRLIALGVARSGLRAAVRAAFVATPGVGMLVRRLHAARVQTSAESREACANGEAASGAPVAQAHPPRKAGGAPALILNWAEVPWGAQHPSSALGQVPVFPAGGAASLESDREVIARLRRLELPADAEVVVLVRAWEPPLLELADFLREARRALGRERLIVVQPVGEEGSAPGPAQVDMWRRSLQRVGDPWLRVALPGEGVLS